MNTNLRKKATFYINECSFGKTMENIEIFHNRNTKTLFCIRTKFSNYKVLHSRFISNRNEEN